MVRRFDFYIPLQLVATLSWGSVFFYFVSMYLDRSRLRRNSEPHSRDILGAEKATTINNPEILLRIGFAFFLCVDFRKLVTHLTVRLAGDGVVVNTSRKHIFRI
jgi:hypothetical protein